MQLQKIAALLGTLLLGLASAGGVHAQTAASAPANAQDGGSIQLEGWDRAIYLTCLQQNPTDEVGCACLTLQIKREGGNTAWAAAVFAATNGEPASYTDRLERSQQRLFMAAMQRMGVLATTCGLQPPPPQ